MPGLFNSPRPLGPNKLGRSAAPRPQGSKLQLLHGGRGHLEDESSSAGESHPHALTDPDVNLSAHPAPLIQPPAALPVASARINSALAGQCVPANGLPSSGGPAIS